MREELLKYGLSEKEIEVRKNRVIQSAEGAVVMETWFRSGATNWRGR